MGNCQKANALVEGKAYSIEVWTGPEVSRRLRLPDYKTISTRKW
jgi:hypothetical protein